MLDENSYYGVRRMLNNEKNKRVLKNGIEIDQMNDYETDFIYNEIFEEKVYLKNDVIIKDDSCIFDIGANIGLFSLYNLMNYEHSSIYAFEPSPQLCEKIRYNIRDYSERIHIHQCGLSSKEGNATFSFYPGYSIISGFKTDDKEDLRTIKSGLMGNEQPKDEFEENCINEMLEEKLKGKVEYDCPLQTISSIIEQEQIKVIDLLKIDAEKSELEILAGIKDKDWDIIMQLIMEVHDIDNKEKNNILTLLQSKGFEVIIDEEDELQGSGIINIFAIRTEYKKKYGDLGSNSLKNQYVVSIAANFSMDPLYTMLPKLFDELKLEYSLQFADYNQVFQELLNPDSSFAKNTSGGHILLIKPEEWLHYKEDGDQQYLQRVTDQFIQAVNRFSSQISYPLLLMICPDSSSHSSIASIQNRLISELQLSENIRVVDVKMYHSMYQVQKIFDELSNEMGHLPYGKEYYEFLSVIMTRRLFEENVSRFKMIVADCDNTLWKGICGEVQPEQLEVGDREGALQEFLVQKYKEGFLIGLCSKNNEADVLRVFNEKKDMPLKKEQIVSYRINWNKKSLNLKEIAKEVNIGLDSILFIDDNAMECNEVLTNCSEVVALQWPFSKYEGIEHVWKLDKHRITRDDRKRNESYQWNVQVNQVKESSYTYKQFIEELEIDLRIDQIEKETIERASQLTQRTNQFNFTTIRRTTNEIANLVNEGKQGYTVYVKDRFGDYGIVGFFVLHDALDEMVLESFLLSCRVLGRGIEYKILDWIGKKLQSEGKRKLKLVFINSNKNVPAKEFLEKEFGDCRYSEDEKQIEYEILVEKLLSMEEKFLSSLIQKESEKVTTVSSSMAWNARAYEQMQECIFEHLTAMPYISQFFENNEDGEMEEAPTQNSIVDQVKAVFSKVLKIPAESIEEQEEIDTYIQKNSMKVIEITVELRKVFPAVKPTLLFKYRRIDEIANELSKYERIEVTEDNNRKASKIETYVANEDDIAIVGLNLRLPGAKNAEEFWDNLKNGRCSIGEIPSDRWDVEMYYDPLGSKGKYYNKQGGFLDGVDEFDASYFQISPLEAETMDPQQRLMLELVEGLLEDAGYTKETMERKTGVFVGAISGDYASYANEAAMQGNCAYRDVDYYQIANRISYFYDLKGPSLAIDTACSSSGTALYYAIQSISNGDCDSAIVGGVNLFLHPGRFIQYSQMNVLSHDGVLRPFSNQASGTVYGEGVVAVLIKPLTAARKAGDQIYGVIKGCAINSVGKTNGFTVPSPTAQADLIEKALERAKVSPEEISYVEAHGTGTVLGDPIEIEGLSDAYRRSFEKHGKEVKTQYCAIGSVKANIGHTESVATLAGLAKILMQMKHGMLAPTLHVGKLNDYIPFETSPVVVQQELEVWKRKQKNSPDGMVEIPRKAALSSFGAGGVNTHFIIEESIENAKNGNADQIERVFVFSALSKDGLDKYVERFVSTLTLIDETQESWNLEDVAYTLQVGRLEHPYRVAIIAKDIVLLQEEMKAYLSGLPATNHCIFGIYEGKISSHKKACTNLSLEEIARMWVRGSSLDWSTLYVGRKPHKVSLPQIEFERERYWIEISKDVNKSSNESSQVCLNSMIDVMHEGLMETCFTKHLTSKNPYITDHIIDGECILPGAVYFEFLCEAIQQLGLSLNQYKIHDICWMSVLKITSKVDFQISIERTAEELKCSFWTKQNNEKVVHAVMFVREAIHPLVTDEKVHTEHDYNSLLRKEECYQALSAKKYQYGTTYQVIDSVRYNDEYAFGKLIQDNDWHEITLAPNLIDGALQVVSIWAREKTKGFNGTFIPYTMDEVILYNALKTEGTYHVIVKETTIESSVHVQKYDLDIYDSNRTLCMQMKGYYARSLKEFTQTEAQMTETLHFFEPELKLEPLRNIEGSLKESLVLFSSNDLLYQNMLNYNDNTTILVQTSNEEDYVQLLQEQAKKGLKKICVVFDLTNGSFELETMIKDALIKVQSLSKAALRIAELDQVKIICLYEASLKQSTIVYKSLGAALNVIKEEITKIEYQCIGLPVSSTPAQTAKILADELRQEKVACEVQYDGKQRYTASYSLLSNDVVQFQDYDYGEGKVYLITGGLGRLGFETAKHIAKNSEQAVLCLVGRSAKNEKMQEKIDELSKFCKEVQYIRADLSKQSKVFNLVQQIKIQYGKINGIVHCAGVLKDALLINKSMGDEEQVILPKAKGAVYLDEATKDEVLDFFVLFSSTSSVMPHIGQCDYAYANRFLDEFCVARERLREQKCRHGRTFSINWSLWKDGGMTVGEEGRKRIEKQYGLQALTTEQGMKLFDAVLSTEISRIGIILGNQSKIIEIFKESSEIQTKTIQNETIDTKQIAINVIKQSISNVIKLPAEKIKDKDSFSRHGFDSITLASLANEIGNELDIIVSPAVFYEYTTVEALAEYLNKTGKVKAKKVEITETKLQAEDIENTLYSEKDIAIVGMSGIFPGASNVSELWNNLIEKKCAMTEIPIERWDWRDYYGTKENQTEIKYGGFIDNADKFDPAFFGISPKEALYMDPQQRLFLQTAWHCIEDAGHNPGELSGSETGVFVAASINDYNELIKDVNAEIDPFLSSGVNNSIIANRVSYLLNLHGPSEVIDTACSSSLVGLKHAIEAIQNGHCSNAIVGGVNVIARPKFFISFGKAGMLSKEGRCATFDKSADGYARGEGVGALYIKKLSQAMKDHDHIYAVVKGVSENHGGKSHSLTAPNPKAQAEVIQKAYETAGIGLDTVDYIECHGTGTSLGDPIEVNGLKEAFASQNVKNDNHCIIGALKANIGHLECASGAAGLIKTAMILSKKQVPGIANFKHLNPYIDLEDSPFRIINELTPLQPKVNEDGRRIPLRAGISAFGFGGTNAHAVLEEYIADTNREKEPQGPYIVTFSAKTKESLHGLVNNFVGYLQKNENLPSLADVAYTLQVGRLEMAQRLALVVNDFAQLEDALSSYLNKTKTVVEVYEGQVLEGELAENWQETNSLVDIAKLWVNGMQVDWEVLHQEEFVKRCSVPGYCFEENAFWFNVKSSVYTKVFSGEEYYLRDHKVQGKKVLPGVEHMDLVYEAVEQLLGKQVTGFEHIYYADLVTVDSKLPLKCVLNEVDEKIEFKILTVLENGEEHLCSQGIALINVTTCKQDRIDLGAIRARMLHTIEKQDFYNKYTKRDFEVIGTFQTLDAISHNDSELFAVMSIAGDGAQYFAKQRIYSAFYDGALQSTAVLTGYFEENNDEYLPFTFEKVEIYDRLSEVCYVYVNEKEKKKEERIFDVTLMDGSGKPLVAFYGYHARIFKGMKEDTNKLGFVNASFREQELIKNSEYKIERILVMGENEKICDTLKTVLFKQEKRWVEVKSLQTSVPCRFEIFNEFVPDCIIYDVTAFVADSFEKVLKKVKEYVFGLQAEICRRFKDKRITTLYMVSEEEAYFCTSLGQALSGFARSVAYEYRNKDQKLIRIKEYNQTLEQKAEMMLNEIRCFDSYEVLYNNGRRFVVAYDYNEETGGTDNVAFHCREQGVYVVTGGMGGLGSILIEHLMKNNPSIQVIAVGSSAYDEKIVRKIENLFKGHFNISYEQANLNSYEDTKELVDRICNRYGTIHGIFHCAGVLKDSLLVNKQTIDVDKVLGAKVKGAFYLDLATKKCDLDVVVYFSSVSGFAGNQGQTDYSFANSFLDRFAAARTELVRLGLRKGKTIAIAWPFWKDGGMQLSKENQNYIVQTTGTDVLDTQVGLSALDIILGRKDSWTGVIYGNQVGMRQWISSLNRNKHMQEDSKKMLINPSGKQSMKQAYESKVYDLIANMLGVKKEKLISNTKLEEMGMNSFLYVDLSNQINEQFGIHTLPSIFFEYATAPRLVEQIWLEYGASMIIKEEREQVCEEHIQQEITVDIADTKDTRKDEEDPVVIVGMDVLLPGAKDANEFWECLKEECDLIDTIPEERIHLMGDYEDLESFFNDACAKQGGFLPCVTAFDAKFFHISKKEAEYMDPQHRLLLQSAWKTIEDAGYRASDFSETDTGVYVGIAGVDYYDVMKDSNCSMDAYMLTGNMAAFAANRISYLLNLNGPSEPVNTACSSTLVAFEHAAKDIQLGKCQCAIVGGVNLLMNRRYYEATADSGVLSKNGRCKTFDKTADGYVRSEGVGTFLVKKRSKAIKDHDHIYGILRGIEVNHCGHTSSLTAPSETRQKELLIKTYQNAGVPFNTVGYIEMHGTGTKLGDPIEFQALKKASHEIEESNLPLRNPHKIGLSTAKTLVGHLEAAAGVAGMAKALLSIKHKQITGNINGEELNPYIQLEDTPFFIVSKTMEWKNIIDYKGNQVPRRVGISSFGFGGSIAHAIVEEYMGETNKKEEKGKQIIVLSAKTKEALNQSAKNLYDYINSDRSVEDTLSNIAFTLCVGREEMEYRFACVVESKEELADALLEFVQGTSLQKVANNYLEEIAQKWINKEYGEIGELFKDGDYQRVSLPSYPFDSSQRYWIAKNVEKKSNNNNIISILKKVWIKQEIEKTAKRTINTILCLSSQKEISQKIQLAHKDGQVIEVMQGTKFEQVGNFSYQINPWKESDYEELISTISQSMQGVLTIVVYDWYREYLNKAEQVVQIMARLVRSLSRAKHPVQFVYGYDMDSSLQSLKEQALAGFFKTVCIEEAWFHGHVVGIEKKSMQKEIAQILYEELTVEEIEPIEYRNSARYVRTIEKVKTSQMQEKSIPIKSNGVYVLTGGMGGIGRVLAKEITSAGANAILLGRSEKTEKINEALRECSKPYAKAIYVSCDLSNLKQVKETKDLIEANYGLVNGIFHLAGVTKDGLLKYKADESIREVLDPKVEGLLHLDEAFANSKLEFFVVMSSVAGIFGNKGQSDYAYANAFEDAFVEFRDAMTNQGMRYGKTLAIALAYWSNGGMRINADVLEELKKSLGVEPISDEVGKEACALCMNLSENYYAVMYGQEDCYLKMQEIAGKNKMNIMENQYENIIIDSQKVKLYLYQLFAELFGLDVEEMDEFTQLKDYGIDSIVIQKFNRIASEKFHNLPKMLLYECTNIKEVTDYIVKHALTKEKEFQKEINVPINVTPIRMVEETEPITENEIAVIGASGKYPMAENLEEFWENLSSGKDCVSEVPKSRWDWREYNKGELEDERQEIYCHWGGFLDHIDQFDPYVFGISPREAIMMDPQERILLEEVWKAFEAAGCANEYLSKKSGKKQKSNVGVFVGTTSQTYSYRVLEAQQASTEDVVQKFSATTPWSIANRISYTFGFNGPSFAVDTACSSSLTAVKLACDSLKKGECSIAVVAGVNLYTHPYKYAHMCSTGMLSKTGRCYSFGAKADGFVPGEGMGVLLLKRLPQAENDHDNIMGIIKGSYVNHGVSANGFTVPNPASQAEVIEAAMKDAKVAPEDISYIEAHGTGTQLGDPIEIEGLKKAFSLSNSQIPCPIGSVKSNIGHLESASGISGITKILLQFQKQQLLPSIHAEELNENIDFNQCHFRVQRTLEAWKQPVKEMNGSKQNIPRIAGISSFGVGGTNSHVILQEYNKKVLEYERVNVKKGSFLFLLSAQDEETLIQHANNMFCFMLRKEESFRIQHPLVIAKKDRISEIYAYMEHAFGVGVDNLDADTVLEEYCYDYFLLQRFAEKLNEEYSLEFDGSTLKEMTIRELANQIEKVDDLSSDDTVVQEKEIWMEQFCYTLQIGRVELEERLAFVADGLEDAIQKLADFLKSGVAQKEIYRARAKNGMKMDKESLLESWSKGAVVDWKSLYENLPERLFDLPEYPFNQSSFWIELKRKQISTEYPSYLEETGVKYEKLEQKEVPFMKKEETLGSIKKILADVLYMEESKVDESKPFIDLGLDSILGVEFVNKVNKEFHLEVKATRIYDYPSVEEFAEYIATQTVEIPVEKSPNTVTEDKKKLVIHLPSEKEDKVDKVAEPKPQPAMVQIPLAKLEKRVQLTVPIVEKQTSLNEHKQSNKIAVIGMSLRTPGAEDTEEFWNLISRGKNSVTDIPKERWDTDKYYDPTGTKKDMSYCKKAGVLSDIDQFDPLFFHISPNDAKNMDPQQRMFLEESYKTFENAGYSKQDLNGCKCGVYVGVASINEYNPTNMFNTSSILASRIAYYLNLKGPALAIDTACSSSMVAIHMACNSLLNKKADMMLVGGVSIYLTEKLFIQMSGAGMLSKDGVCRPFSDDANGFVASEAVGAVLLKRLDDAVADGDNILGIITASGSNQDGRTNGITAPSAKSQKELEIEVYKKAGINPEKITMVEAHGTGTNLGDPIEFDALNESFSEFTDKKQYCALGSVKANIGHTAAASGVVSLIKTILCMNKKKLPPQINFSRINKQINLENSQFYINQHLTTWNPDENGKLYAAVSSFGFSGTNVHVVLENYEKVPTKQTRKIQRPYYLIGLSAESKDSLRSRVDDLVSWLDKNPDLDLADISYTLMKCRSQMNLRVALVVSNITELKNKLIELLCNGMDCAVGEKEDGKVIHMLKPMMKQLAKMLIRELNDEQLTKAEYYEKLQALASMYMVSAEFPFDQILQKDQCSKLMLPVYRFSHKRYWYEEDKPVEIISKERQVEKEEVHLHKPKLTFRNPTYKNTENSAKEPVEEKIKVEKPRKKYSKDQVLEDLLLQEAEINNNLEKKEMVKHQEKIISKDEVLDFLNGLL